jgi:hypothetical protein
MTRSHPCRFLSSAARPWLLPAAICFALVAAACGGSEAGDDSALDAAGVSDRSTGMTDPSALPEDVRAALENGPAASVSAATSCTNYTHRWVFWRCYGCSATKSQWRRQICLYNSWYWENVFTCRYPMCQQ